MTSPLRLLLIVWLVALTLCGQAMAAVQKDPRIEAELVPMSQWVVPGSTAILAIRQKISPQWHTYWRNPGDSGGATEAQWDLPAGFKAGDFLWPLPERKPLMGLMSYVYSDQVYLPVPIEVPAGLTTGEKYSVSANVLFLVCSDEMCVPVNMTLSTDLLVGEGAAPLTARHGRAIENVVTGAPRAAEIDAAARVENGQLIINAAGGPLVGLKPRWAYFYAHGQTVLDHAAKQKVELGPQGLTFSVPAGRATREGVTEPVTGTISTDAGAWEITASSGAALAGTTGDGSVSTDAPDKDQATVGFWQAAMFALLGGLILNLMPCVFPVLAMKAAALTRSAHDPVQLRHDGFAFTAGVLVSFGALAGGLLALRALGQSIGWGFQLQSPAVVGALALLMLAVAMNLSGIFSFGGRLQQLGGIGAQRSGLFGAFLTGVLAVVVAAPCTAPFMAVATGAALVLSWPLALAVFLLLGVGLALPYLVLSLSPRLLRGLPKPGPWMERLRNILALPMYATAVWLAWVFVRQTNSIVWLAVAAVLLAVMLWLVGRAQIKPNARIWVGTAAAFAVAFVGAGVMALRTPVTVAAQGSHSALPSNPWSNEVVQAGLSQGKPVVVNFTADWCVTCKINERTALASERTAKAFADTGTIYLVGDWTRSDPAITAELQRHGRSGVPLYLVYSPNAAQPVVLPQILTEGVVIKAVKNAARP